MVYLGTRPLSSALYCAIVTDENYAIYKFIKPKFFDKKHDVIKIINFYRDNILSIINRYKISAAAIKKTEANSIQGRGLEDGRRIQLYSEGMVISTIGSCGKFCAAYYTNNMKSLYPSNFADKTIQVIAAENRLTYEGNGTPDEDENAKDALVAAICCKMELQK